MSRQRALASGRQPARDLQAVPGVGVSEPGDVLLHNKEEREELGVAPDTRLDTPEVFKGQVERGSHWRRLRRDLVTTW